MTNDQRYTLVTCRSLDCVSATINPNPCSGVNLALNQRAYKLLSLGQIWCSLVCHCFEPLSTAWCSKPHVCAEFRSVLQNILILILIVISWSCLILIDHCSQLCCVATKVCLKFTVLYISYCPHRVILESSLVGCLTTLFTPSWSTSSLAPMKYWELLATALTSILCSQVYAVCTTELQVSVT